MNLNTPEKIIRKELGNQNKSFYNSQTILRDELLKVLERLKEENQGKYSLNNFSKKTGIQKQRLSDFFNGRLTFKKRIVLEKLEPIISKETLKKYLKEVDFESLKTETRPDKSIDIFSIDENGTFYLTDDQRKFSEDPYSFALLLAFDLEDYEPNIEWISKRIGLSKKESKARLDRITDLGLLEKTDGFYRSSGLRPNLIDSKLNKTTHEHFKRLSNLISNQYISEKDDQVRRGKNYFHYMYFNVDPADLDKFESEIKKSILKFQKNQINSNPKQICSLMTSFSQISQ